MWDLGTYVIHKETDVLRFETKEGDILGYVAFDNGGQELTEALNQGADPIQERWEDGVGNYRQFQSS